MALAFDAEWILGVTLHWHCSKMERVLRVFSMRVSFVQKLFQQLMQPILHSCKLSCTKRISCPFIRNRDAFLLARIVRKYLCVLPTDVADHLVEAATQQRSENLEEPDASQILAAFFLLSFDQP
jgi:hypothetical protein